MTNEYDVEYDHNPEADEQIGSTGQYWDGPGEYVTSGPPWKDINNPKHRHMKSRCVAVKRDGTRCQRPVLLGSETVCRHHGGSTGHVKARARERLEDAADRMARQLLRMAEADDVSDAVKLNAIRDALDRSGVTAKSAVEVSVGPLKPYEEVFASIQGGSRAESRARRGLPLDEVDQAVAAESNAEAPDPDGPSCAACGRSYPADLLAWVEDIPEICRACADSRELEPAFGDREPAPDPLGVVPDLPGDEMPPRFGGLGGVDGYAAPTANVGADQGGGFLTHEQAVAAERQSNRRGRRARRL